MSIAGTALGDLQSELQTTRRVLERVPDDHFDWKPHEKNFTLGEMSSHIANLLSWGVMILSSDELDLAEDYPPQPAAEDSAGLLELFDEKSAALLKALDGVDDDRMLGTWTLRMGDREISALSRVANIRGFVINHMIHHRGQLTLYLRLLDVPLPPVYGPTADENPFG